MASPRPRPASARVEPRSRRDRAECPQAGLAAAVLQLAGLAVRGAADDALGAHVQAAAVPAGAEPRQPPRSRPAALLPLFALGRLRSLGNLACHAELVQTARCLVSRAAVHCADTHAEPAGGVALSLPAEPALQQPEARWLAHLPHGARRSALQLLMLQPRHQAWPIALRSWHCEAGAL